MRSPFVMLWAQRVDAGEGDVRLEVVDEYVRADRGMGEHLAAMERRGWPRPAWVGADPAGNQRSEQTGRSTVALLREAGYRVRTRRRRLAEGLEMVRRLLEGGESRGGLGSAEGIGGFSCGGGPGLVIHPRCRKLIEAMTSYHFDVERPYREEPVKDGHDHAADALRYLVTNLDGPGGAVEVRGY